MPSKKAAPAKKRAGGKKRIGLTSALGPKATTVVVICVMAGGIALASWQKEQAAKPKNGPTETVLAADLASPPALAPIKGTKSKAPGGVTSTPSALAATATSSARGDATVTGCLERAGDAFRLKDTAGEDAPKSRSWKSGFLKKGAAAITVIDSSRSLRLGSHVGHRVSISGTLDNRELRAGAIHQVASSCKVTN